MSTDVKFSHPKRIIFVIFGLITVASIIFLFIKFTNNDTTSSSVSARSFLVTGGYAETKEEVDPHLQKLLDEQNQLLKNLTETSYVEGAYIADGANSNTFRGMEKILPELTTQVRVDTTFYLTREADLKSFINEITAYFEEQGYTIVDTSQGESFSYIFVRDFNPAVENSSATAFYQDEYSFAVYESNPNFYDIYLNITTKTLYPLSGIPVWSGIQTNTEALENWSWFSNEGEVSAARICAVGPNSVMGYWDSRFNCLAYKVNSPI